MTPSKNTESSYKAVERCLGYFDRQALAAYRNEPHKYIIASDDSWGELQTTEEYYSELAEAGKHDESVHIRFGYRTLKDGNLALVVWLPDLFEKSKAHIKQWKAFHLADPQWTTEPDERFTNWVKRYLDGSSDFDDGPLCYLGHTIKVINGLTNELVGASLYKWELDETLSSPAAENTHRYQDAHKELYGYLIDGLNKDCISRLAGQLGKRIKVGDKKTLDALVTLLPQLDTSPGFKQAMHVVSEQRRLGSHGVREPATHFPASEQFTKDLWLCLEGIKEVLTALEQEFGVMGEQANKRYQAKKGLPRITRPAEENYSIVQASRIVGKTVERIEYGFREDLEGFHASEALIIYFTDGSIMGLQAGCNVMNLITDENGLRPEDFHVDFVVNWVPELTVRSYFEGVQKLW